MDPGYLRGAVLDAEGDHHANVDPARTLSGRLQSVVRAVRAAFVRLQHP